MDTGFSQSHTEPFTCHGEKVCAKFEVNYFAEGTSKCVFRGRITPVNNWEFNHGERCVVKYFRDNYRLNFGLKEDAWKADIRASLKTKDMAERFNVKYNDECIATIKVLIPSISKVKRNAFSGYAMVTEGAFVAIEPFLYGEYVKFSNNFGYVNPNEDTLVPEAFSHFTYHESNGEILVTDLQGVFNKKSYIFTDPAIHSITNPRYTFGCYGLSDLGVFGMIKFFQTHKCNRLCDGLRIPQVSNVSDYWEEDLHHVIDTFELQSDSTYTYELQNVGLPAQRIQELHNIVAKTLALSGRHGEQLHRTRTIGTQTEAATNVPTTMQQEATVSTPSAATGPQTTDSNTRPGRVNAQPSLPEYGMDRNPGCMVINNNFNYIYVVSSETRRESEKDKEPRLDDRTLHEIALRLACDWFELAIELGFTIIQATAIEENYQKDITRRGLNMLVKWKQAQSTSDEQQMTTLCTALKKIGRVDIAGFLHGE